MKREIEILLRRSEGFADDALHDWEKNRFDLALVHVEQALQLLIKAKLLDLKGYFEKTHSLRKLLEELAEIWKGNEIRNFIEEYREILKIVELSYIAGRYLAEEFEREDAEKAFEVYRKLKALILE